MSTALRIILPLAALTLGVGGTATLVLTRPESKKTEPEKLATPVEVTKVVVGPENAQIRAQGTVVAAEQVTMFAQVSGRVVWQADELMPGGRFARGDRLLRVDPRDYQVAVEQGHAQIASQEMQVEQELGRRSVAEKEWEMLGGDDASVRGKSLALREPQLKTAEVGLKAAQSALAQAQLNLSRTEVGAPFNAFVQSENVDIGQLVTPQTPLATLVGTDAFWVQVSVPMDRLSWFDVPRSLGATGASAHIWQDIGGERLERNGRVIRLLGDLDPVGNMARVLVEIDDPLGLKAQKEAAKTPAGKDAGAPPAEGVPLLLGSFVQVEIAGKPLPGVLQIPRAALRDDDRVFVVADGKLKIVPVEILWRAETNLYVRGDLSPGDDVIHSPLNAPVEGMALRIIGADGEGEG
jgi:multidrug efflux pump subunit AcrA (membrane-fusion protein)